MEEGSRAGVEEACASGEGVGVPAAGAALSEGIQAPSGKTGESMETSTSSGKTGNIQFVQR